MLNQISQSHKDSYRMIPPSSPGAVELSRRHPMASWLCAMLHCFGSYILADLLLGEPLIDYFSNNSSVLLASAIW